MLHDNLGGEIGLVFEGSSDGEDIYIPMEYVDSC